MSRKKIIAGNWKMHTTIAEGELLVKEVMRLATVPAGAEVIFFPPFTHIASVSTIVSSSPAFKAGAQNCASETKGAYTGEVSVSMLRAAGASSVIIGHSERRSIYHEDHAVLKNKVDRAIEAELPVIFCCGETLPQREQAQHFEIVLQQLQESLFHLPESAMQHVVIAYEPVWAIGTGKTASPQQAQEIHRHIRASLRERYGNDIADRTPVLYGGSVKPDNAAELFSQPDIDGGLIGGAALNAADFVSIIHAAA